MFRCARVCLRRAGLKAEAGASTPGTIPEKLTLRFNTPTKSLFADAKVKMIQIPAQSGEMGVLAGHVPTIAQLKPGIVSVYEDDSKVDHFFISGGFALVSEDSTASVTAAEACALDDLDADAVRSGIASYTQAVAAAKDDVERAEAEIGLEVHEAMAYALTLK